MPKIVTPVGSDFNYPGRRQPEYRTEVVSQVEGVNLDAQDSNIGTNEFRDLLNFRLNTLGDAQTRTGYEQFIFPPEVADGGGSIPNKPIAIMEYSAVRTAGGEQSVYRYVVVAYWHQSTGEVKLWVIDPVAKDSGVVVSTRAFFGQEPIGSMVEYAGAITLSLFDDTIGDVDAPHPAGAVYQIFPNSLPVLVTSPPTWTVMKLGKMLTPTPTQHTFVDDTKGSLFVYNSQNDNGKMKILPDPITGKQPTIELKINAKYWRSKPQGLAGNNIEYMKERLYVPNAKESSTEITNIDQHGKEHPPARAWGYRFIMRRRITDAYGNKFEIVDAPSVDYWVEDVYFCPAVLGKSFNDRKIEYPATIYGRANPNIQNDGGTNWRDLDDYGARWDVEFGQYPFKAGYDWSGFAYLPEVQGFPTNQDYLDLRNLYRDSPVFKAAKLDQDPFFFASVWLGFWVPSDANYPPNDNASTPYQVAVPASKLKGAPMVIWDFSRFPNVPADVFEIDIYRTAHTEPLEKDNLAFQNNKSGDLLFQPNSYSFVGTLKRDGKFTDDIADTELDTGKTPEQEDGFLAGQFTGQVMTEYNQKLAIGNLRETYWVDSPSSFIPPFWNIWGNNSLKIPGFDATDFYPLEADGLGLHAFHYSYVDNQGNESAITDIRVFPFSLTVTKNLHVTFVFPRGYSPAITQIKFYESKWFGLNDRRYSDPVILDVATEMYEATAPIGKYTNPRPQRTVKDDYGPGDVIWSDLNNPFSFPGDNYERQHQYSPVLGMKELIGECWIWTQVSDTLTKLDAVSPRREEENKYQGMISRNCLVKFDQVVFFLSQFGMRCGTSSGPVTYDGKVKTKILEYLNESIPGLEPFSNAKRASMVLLQQRSELWVHFPSSVDLWASVSGDINKSLPQTTIVFRFIGGEIGAAFRGTPLAVVQNYQFDLNKDWQVVNKPGTDIIDASLFRPEHLYFVEASRGKVFAAYYDQSTGNMILQDCDAPQIPWDGYAAAEKPFTLDIPTIRKEFDLVEIQMAASADVTLYTGQRKPSGGYDAERGWIDSRVQAWPVNIKNPGRSDGYPHRAPGIGYECGGQGPAVRIVTRPNALGEHSVTIEGYNIRLALIHNHA